MKPRAKSTCRQGQRADEKLVKALENDSGEVLLWPGLDFDAYFGPEGQERDWRQVLGEREEPDDASPERLRLTDQLAGGNPFGTEVDEDEEEPETDQLHGGAADGLPDSDFDADALRRGAQHETEHTDDPAIAREIAKDHLAEDEDYYDKLEQVEGKHLSVDTKRLNLDGTNTAHKYGCLMLDLPEAVRKQLSDWALENIPDFHLGKGGRELHPHITVAYGFAPDFDRVDQLAGLLQQHGPLVLTLTGLSSFAANDDGTPLIIQVDSGKLHQLRASVEEQFELPGNKYPEFKPHATLAYLAAPEPVAAAYAAQAVDFLPLAVQVDSATWSGADGTKVSIPLKLLPQLGVKAMCQQGQRADETGCTPSTGGGGLGPTAKSESTEGKVKQAHEARAQVVQQMEAAVAKGRPWAAAELKEDLRQLDKAVEYLQQGEPLGESQLVYLSKYGVDMWDLRPASEVMGHPLTHEGIPNLCYENARREFRAQKQAGRNPKYVRGDVYYEDQEGRRGSVDHAWVEVGGKVVDPTPFKHGEGNYSTLPQRPALDHFVKVRYEPRFTYDEDHLKDKLDYFPKSLQTKDANPRSLRSAGHVVQTHMVNGCSVEKVVSELAYDRWGEHGPRLTYHWRVLRGGRLLSVHDSEQEALQAAQRQTKDLTADSPQVSDRVEQILASTPRVPAKALEESRKVVQLVLDKIEQRYGVDTLSAVLEKVLTADSYPDSLYAAPLVALAERYQQATPGQTGQKALVIKKDKRGYRYCMDQGRRVVCPPKQGAAPDKAQEAKPAKPAKAKAKAKIKVTVEDTVAAISKLKQQFNADSLKDLAQRLQGHTVAELNQIKKQLGLKASGVKSELARKIAERALGASPPTEKPMAPKAGGPEEFTTEPDAPTKQKKLEDTLLDSYEHLTRFVEFQDGVVELRRLWYDAKERDPELTLKDFHAELERLNSEHKIELRQLNEVQEAQEPELAINRDDRLYYYIRVKPKVREQRKQEQQAKPDQPRADKPTPANGKRPKLIAPKLKPKRVADNDPTIPTGRA